MKKSILLAAAAFYMAGCSEQHLSDGYESHPSAPQGERESSQAGILDYYLEKARWGDGEAYMKLAGCYHDGIGVKPDIMGTLYMLMMASQYGVPNHTVEEYLHSLPETDDMKMAFDAIEELDRKASSSDSIAEVLITRGSSDGYAIKGAIQVERGDTLGGLQSFRTGSEAGSTFAELLLCLFSQEETGYVVSLNVDMLRCLSDRSPVVNKLLGDIYSGYDRRDTDYIDESLAAMYYRKADEQGFLGKWPARWLISYYDRNGITIDAGELERLRILCGHDKAPDGAVPDSVNTEPEYAGEYADVTSE